MPRDSTRSRRKAAAGTPAARRNSGSSGRTRGRSTRAGQDERGGLELATLQAFRTIFASARWHDAEVRRVAGISGSQLWALAEIARERDLRVNDLSERMAIHQTTASNLINALVERKLVRRERDAGDQRVVRLHITTEGKRMLLRAPGPYTGLLVDALRHLDTPRLKRLRNGLLVLTQALRAAAPDAAGQTLMGE